MARPGQVLWDLTMCGQPRPLIERFALFCYRAVCSVGRHFNSVTKLRSSESIDQDWMSPSVGRTKRSPASQRVGDVPHSLPQPSRLSVTGAQPHLGPPNPDSTPRTTNFCTSLTPWLGWVRFQQSLPNLLLLLLLVSLFPFFPNRKLPIKRTTCCIYTALFRRRSSQ